MTREATRNPDHDPGPLVLFVGAGPILVGGTGTRCHYPITAAASRRRCWDAFLVWAETQDRERHHWQQLNRQIDRRASSPMEQSWAIWALYPQAADRRVRIRWLRRHGFRVI